MNKIFLNMSVLACVGLFAVGCSTSKQVSVMEPEDHPQISDPFENTNRAIFKFNNKFDDHVLNPTLRTYRYAVPAEIRTGLGNFLRNLRTPMILGNELLQGDLEGARVALLRGVINTMVGFGGVFDFAGKEGLTHQGEDFGQTLAVWGVGHGPYLVVPFFGASSTRDYIGYIVEIYADPLRLYLYNIDRQPLNLTRTGLDYLRVRNNLMDALEDLRNSSIDYYAATRSVYYQSRDAAVNDGAVETIEADSFDIPDYE